MQISNEKDYDFNYFIEENGKVIIEYNLHNNQASEINFMIKIGWGKNINQT